MRSAHLKREPCRHDPGRDCRTGALGTLAGRIGAGQERAAALRARPHAHAQGRLGAVVSIVAQHTTSTAQFVAPDNWRAAPEEAPGGALTAVGVHALDHMIEFAGGVRDVRCVTGRTMPGPSDDTTTVMLRFHSGATGLIFCSVATSTNFSFTLYGSKGMAEISKPNLQTLRFVPTSDQA